MATNIQQFSVVDAAKDMFRITTVYLVLSFAVSVEAGELVPTVSHRFTGPGVEEVPDLQRHVLPLLGRLGCNSRECHGSFQGRGGFRLSLFGYDFAADHASLTKDGEGRVNLDDPAASLILRKPTLGEDHEGGERFKPDSWEHHLLHRWIEGGAIGTRPDGAEFVKLQVEPQEIVFATPGETAVLTAIAHWSDGTREDVTDLCRFRSNDESLAAINGAGVVTALARGDTHVVAFYDNGVTPVAVLTPVSDSTGKNFPPTPTPTKIDELVVQKLSKAGIIPADVCTDAEFLRRVSLDVTGTLPTPKEITTFLADESVDKRAAKIEELLNRPTYSAWWATRLGDLLGNSEQNLPVGGEQGVRRQKSEQWYDWLRRRVEQNVGYDEIVEGVVLGRGRAAGQSVGDYFAEMSAYFRSEEGADFAARETVPYFWTRGRFTPPQPLRFSYAFLGIRLECAQCHKHPYDQWTKDDYEGFQAFFDGVGNSYGDRRGAEEMKKTLGLTADQDSSGYKKLFVDLAASGKVVPWQEVTVSSLEKRLENARRSQQKTGGRVFTPKLLGGEEVTAGGSEDCRAPLMDWLRQPDNPYFARAMVNRTWAHFFGVGIVDPPDDMNLANPPSNEPLLNYLAEQFVAHDFDLKWLCREITTSRTYQLSWKPNATNERDERNFSRALVRRLPAEVVYDAIVHATATETDMQSLHTDVQTVRSRAIGVSSGYDNRDSAYVTKLFGKPAREGICDCERSNEPSLLQTIYLRNDTEVLKLLDRKESWLQQVAQSQEDVAADDWIRAAYLRTFSRPPSDPKLVGARQHLEQVDDARTGRRDLLWALLNSKEFLLNH